MASKDGRLTAIACRAIKPGERLYDGNGLMLLADKSGARWYFRFTSPENGRRRDAGLGPLSIVTLAKAREGAEALQKVVRSGRDPIEDRARASAQAKAE